MQLVFKISNLCDRDPPTSQTDRQTTCNLNTALCISASRGKNESKKTRTGVFETVTRAMVVLRSVIHRLRELLNFGLSRSVVTLE